MKAYRLMGKLRFERKKKAMSPERYQELLGVLKDAVGLSGGADLFYDLDPDEAPAAVRKEFLFVAEKEEFKTWLRVTIKRLYPLVKFA